MKWAVWGSTHEQLQFEGYFLRIGKLGWCFLRNDSSLKMAVWGPFHGRILFEGHFMWEWCFEGHFMKKWSYEETEKGMFALDRKMTAWGILPESISRDISMKNGRLRNISCKNWWLLIFDYFIWKWQLEIHHLKNCTLRNISWKMAVTGTFNQIMACWRTFFCPSCSLMNIFEKVQFEGRFMRNHNVLNSSEKICTLRDIS